MLNTKTHVTVRGHNAFVAGRKPEAFSDAENKAMRERLALMKAREKLSQTRVGELLGVGQQAIAAILNGGGFSRPTAMKLAQLFGFDSPESFLTDLGVKPRQVSEGSAWFERDIAMSYGRRLNLDADAMAKVNERYVDTQYASRRSKWWVERYIVEDRELEEQRQAMKKSDRKSGPLIEPAPRRKPKRSGTG